jgi:hypothetical protein
VSDVADKIVDGTHTRANVRAAIACLEDCHVRGVPVPQQLADALPIVAARLLKSDSQRIQSTAAKLVLAMLKHNLEIAQTADKMSRLDAGMATERVETPIKFIRGTDGENV